MAQPRIAYRKQSAGKRKAVYTAIFRNDPQSITCGHKQIAVHQSHSAHIASVVAVFHYPATPGVNLHYSEVSSQKHLLASECGVIEREGSGKLRVGYVRHIFHLPVGSHQVYSAVFIAYGKTFLRRIIKNPGDIMAVKPACGGKRQ